MEKTAYPHESFIQDSIVTYLAGKGYSKNVVSKDLHEHGVDVRVCNKNYSRYFLVECKGGAINAKSVTGTESVNFVIPTTLLRCLQVLTFWEPFCYTFTLTNTIHFSI